MSLPTAIDLVVGEEFRSPVTGAGSQGYRWIVTVSGSSGAVSATVDPVPPSDPSASGSFPRVLTILGLATGVATVHLALTRSGGRIREEWSLTVRVHAATTV